MLLLLAITHMLKDLTHLLQQLMVFMHIPKVNIRLLLTKVHTPKVMEVLPQVLALTPKVIIPLVMEITHMPKAMEVLP